MVIKKLNLVSKQGTIQEISAYKVYLIPEKVLICVEFHLRRDKYISVFRQDQTIFMREMLISQEMTWAPVEANSALLLPEPEKASTTSSGIF